MFINTPIWFLWALFQLNLIFYALNLIANKTSEEYADLLLALFSLFVGLIGYGCGVLGYNLPMFLDSTFTSIPYFCMGNFLWKKELLTHKSKKFLIWGILLCFLLTYMVAGGLNYRTNSFNVSFLATYLGGFAGSLFMILLAELIGNVKCISYIGRYSLVVLCTHYLVMDVICPIILKIKMPIVLSLVLSLLLVTSASCLIAPFLKRFFPYVIGKKETIKLIK